MIERPEAPTLVDTVDQLEERLAALEKAGWIGTVFTKETCVGKVSATSMMMRNIGHWGEASIITSKIAKMLAYAKSIELMKARGSASI